MSLISSPFNEPNRYDGELSIDVRIARNKNEKALKYLPERKSLSREAMLSIYERMRALLWQIGRYPDPLPIWEIDSILNSTWWKKSAFHYYDMLIEAFQKEDTDLSPQLAEVIQQSYECYFWDVPFPLKRVSRWWVAWWYPGHREYYSRLYRIIPPWNDISQEKQETGNIIEFSESHIDWYMNMFTTWNIHPKTLLNLFSKNTTIDLIEVSSYISISQPWRQGLSRIAHAVAYYGLCPTLYGYITFPDHHGDDGYFYGNNSYEPKISGNKAESVLLGNENPPLIVVQEDRWKWKFWNSWLDMLKSAWMFRWRTVLSFHKAHDEMGSEGRNGEREANRLRFLQISGQDMDKIETCHDNSPDLIRNLQNLCEPQNPTTKIDTIQKITQWLSWQVLLPRYNNSAPNK